MLRGVVRVNHFILHSHVIATKELDDIPSRMDEIGDVINDTFDSDLVACQSLQRTEGRLGGRVYIVTDGFVCNAVA